MRKLSDKQIASFIQLDGPARFRHFIKHVVDTGTAWALWDDGWALMRDDDGRSIFPIWPATEYASSCATGDWQHYRAKAIALDEILDELLPRLRDTNVGLGVFPTPQGKGVTAPIEEVDAALRTELERYANTKD